MTRRVVYIVATTLAASLMRAQSAQEYALKAAVIYNITKFVEWPQDAFNGRLDPLHVCVLGENPFGDALVQAFSGKVHDGRSFTVRNLRDMNSAGGCQVLFVSASEQKRFRSILEEASSHSTLTIGDSDGFTAAGGIVNLKLEEQKIRLQINLAAAERGRIRISSRLLSLAEVVGK